MSFDPPWLPERAARTPERVALVSEGCPVTFQELAARARRVATWLGDQGVGPGDRIALHVRRGVRFVELLHGAALCGASLLPLNLRLAVPEQRFQLRDAGAKLLVHDGSLAPELSGQREARALALPAKLPETHACFEPERVAPDEILALVYTSGTTGTPKGAELSHAGFFWSALAHALHLGTRPSDRWLACLPLFHVGGLALLVRSVLYGVAVVIHDRFDAELVSRALDEDGISHVSLVPTMLARVLEARGRKPAPSSLHCVLLGGGPASPALLEQARKQGFPLVPTYGLTEATSQVATGSPHAPLSPSDGGLQPLPGIAVRITRDDGFPARPGEAGEIQVRGPTLMRGYHRRPAETAHALHGGWLHTGDIGVLAADGTLRVLDRRSDLIVSGGENVYPAEIEEALESHPQVAEAGVSAVPDPRFGRRPAAWVVPRAGCTPSAEQLRSWCRARLAGYKVPVAVRLVAELPRNASGKLQRARLAVGAARPSGTG